MNRATSYMILSINIVKLFRSIMHINYLSSNMRRKEYNYMYQCPTQYIFNIRTCLIKKYLNFIGQVDEA